ncbi:hypothetical protein L873DRAFT_1846940 [Choiromyces venosus 120613-1]|uniref:Uncharacterized protein n=1 Tax=Choiromyces venosus 120613-1 TaxID=1336337 RepID=A0A3N4J6J5_9PEZI|nr:hypothetical protein L873DRAFT_1846940 [Choiromyces venosus 120613-1]
MAISSLVALLAVAPLAFAQPVWAQCGGGVSEYYVVMIHEEASDLCQPGSSTPTTASATVSTTTAPSTTSNTNAKFILSFADSYTQTGFNVELTKPSASNPIGNPTFPGWTSSGGTNWIGYLITEHNPTLTLSYNLAWGGATIDAAVVLPYASTVHSLKDQVATFLAHEVSNKPSYAPWTSLHSGLGLMILAGVIIRVLIRMLPTKRKAIQRTPPMIAQGASAQAAEAMQITDFNSNVLSRASAFASAHSGTKIYSYDTVLAFDRIINSPTAYGYSDAVSYCQATTWVEVRDEDMADWAGIANFGVHEVVAQDVAAVLETGWW